MEQQSVNPKKGAAGFPLETVVMPSREFEKAFDSSTGGCMRQCACGRIHFDSSDNGWDWEEGELEELLVKATREPYKYVPHDHSIGNMIIGGQEIVYGCKCDIAERYETFIVHHSRQITAYLNSRARRLREEAEQTEIEA